MYIVFRHLCFQSLNMTINWQNVLTVCCENQTKVGKVAFPESERGETSNKIPVTSGVPQGTVLAPILRCIFITTPFRLNLRSCLLSDSGNATFPTFSILLYSRCFMMLLVRERPFNLKGGGLWFFSKKIFWFPMLLKNIFWFWWRKKK
jgi:hypothetical protein